MYQDTSQISMAYLSKKDLRNEKKKLQVSSMDLLPRLFKPNAFDRRYNLNKNLI